ncbi:MAG: DUF4336 domain-containing protein [Lyngbya sp. HA4199-MV5]|jgi:hypothetical protein|nr:DUF4336 domain-containing protein [Lyngbya sp. HA4199-MV5]
MLRELDRNLWVAEQPLRYFGLSVGTRMTIVRLADGELALISPIQISDAVVSQLDKLGAVKHIIAPNLYHYLFVDHVKAIYPNATLWAAPGLEAKKPELSIDQIIGGHTTNGWAGLETVFFDGFRTIGLSGFDALNECVFFHAASHTLILTDTAFHFDDSFPIITQLATRVLGGYKRLSPSILERIATTEKEKVRKSVEKVLTWDFERVIMAHGSIINSNGKEQFKRGYDQFLG